MGKKENLQTRREFFKQSAKAALPILAMVTMPGFIMSCSDDDDEEIL